tara:strand:- start:184 stop:510 length:327 start_codon:yes stop_codon:yes gene_type:complete
MANTFHMISADVTTSDPTVLTAGGGETLVVVGFQVANVHATTASWLTATVYQSGGSTNSVLAKEINIPVNDAFSPMQGKMVLETGDYIKLDAQANSSLEATISYLKVT